MAQIDLKDATIWIRDGSPTPNKIEVKIGEGDFTWEEKVTRQYIKNRGNLDIVRNGDEEQMTVSFSFVWEYIKGTVGSAGIPTVEDVLKRVNSASAWVSTDADACQPYAVDIIINYVPNCSTGDQEVIIFPDFRYETLSHDLKAGTVSCAGGSNAVVPVIYRDIQSTTLF